MMVGVRVLFGSSAGDGHLLPQLPLARATAAAGHTVAFAAAASHGPRLAADGLELLPVGPPHEEIRRRWAARQAELRFDTIPIPERRLYAFSGRFGEIEAPARLPELRATIERWQPDVVVHESSDLAAPIAAAATGVPSIHHAFGRAIPPRVVERGAATVAALWEAHGLEPDAWAGLYRGTYVDICPPSLQDDAPPVGTRVQHLRPAAAARTQSEARSLVYVTLGTIFNGEALFRDLLAAFAPLDCELFLTVGSNLDPAALEPLPANARVERYVPQEEILPRARAVVAHGGSGSTFGALAHACPILFVPQGADQFENAQAVTAAGAGLVLYPAEQDVPGLRGALTRLLADPSYGNAAARLAAEIAAMPSAEQAAAALFAG